jgi:hypothetical protein
MGYYLYKGLKKPLVFFGLKGKYIILCSRCHRSGVIAAFILSKFGLLGSLLGLQSLQEVFISSSKGRTKTDSTTRPKILTRYSFFQKDSTTKDF